MPNPNTIPKWYLNLLSDPAFVSQLQDEQHRELLQEWIILKEGGVFG